MKSYESKLRRSPLFNEDIRGWFSLIILCPCYRPPVGASKHRICRHPLVTMGINAWNEFEHAHGGMGLSKAEMKQAYHAQKRSNGNADSAVQDPAGESKQVRELPTRRPQSCKLQPMLSAFPTFHAGQGLCVAAPPSRCAPSTCYPPTHYGHSDPAPPTPGCLCPSSSC